MKIRNLISLAILSFAITMTGSAQKSVSPGLIYNDPGLKKVVQVAIVVRDIEKSSRLWAELLGMPVP
jgi:methylmalonyl-CoA/ethylmalonyl-CoA epimerase